jgi:hypothetical protein
MLECIAMALASAGTLKLGKQCASNMPANPQPAKKNCSAHVVGKLDDNCKGSGSATEDDSKAEHKEVQQCLLQPVTLSAAAAAALSHLHHIQHHALHTAATVIVQLEPIPVANTCTAHLQLQTRRCLLDNIEVPPKPLH